MTQASSVAFADESDFDAGSGLSILRRAVAELPLGDASSAASLNAGARSLERLCLVGVRMLDALRDSDVASLGDEELDGAAAELGAVNEALGQLSARKASRLAEMDAARARLYETLVALSEAFAPSEPIGRVLGRHGVGTVLDQVLALRRLMSDFQSALLPTTGDDAMNLRWALVVADAELGILMRHPVFSCAPAATQAEFGALRGRIARWRRGRRGLVTASKLYADVAGSAKRLGRLSLRPDVKRHDTRALSELATLLQRGAPGLSLALQSADLLAAVRGLDGELDRLMLDLPLDPARSLRQIARRVTLLCSRALAS